MRGCLRRNGPDHLARGSSEPRVSRMSQAKRAGPPRARHLVAQICEDVSGETPNPGKLRTRVLRMSQAKRPGPPDFCGDVSAPGSLGQTQLLSRQHPVQQAVWGTNESSPSWEARLGAWTTSRAASGSPELRGRLRRNGPDHLARGSSEPRVSRTSQAKRAGPHRARHLGAQICEDVSGETPNPGQLRNESCEDVSSETARTTRFC